MLNCAARVCGEVPPSSGASLIGCQPLVPFTLAARSLNPLSFRRPPPWPTHSFKLLGSLLIRNHGCFSQVWSSDHRSALKWSVSFLNRKVRPKRNRHIHIRSRLGSASEWSWICNSSEQHLVSHLSKRTARECSISRSQVCFGVEGSGEYFYDRFAGFCKQAMLLEGTVYS